jgi:hypothetical protein
MHDVYSAGYMLGQVIYLVLVDTEFNTDVPIDPYDTIYNSWYSGQINSVSS